MKFLIAIFLLSLLGVTGAFAQKVDQALKGSLEKSYNYWRNAMIRKDYKSWKLSTSEGRQITFYNRILSEHQKWPDMIFALPTPPPSLIGLKAVNVNQKANTAMATYFGKVNFGVGGEPSENLMVLYFNLEKGIWKFNNADYINLLALPEVRKQLKANDFTYVNQPDFKASGVIEPLPKEIKERGYVAKVYVWCPGREVKLNFHNDLSKHRFQNDKRAEIIIGGAYDGENALSFTTKVLPGAKGTEPMDIRVFLMSKIPGNNPITIFKYRITPEDITAGKRPAASVKAKFNVTAEHVKAIVTKAQ